MRHVLSRVLTVCAALALVPFLSAQPTDPEATAPESTGALLDYILQPSDVIQVQVFQEPDLDRQLRISQDMRVVLPLIGEVDVSSKTVRQLEAEIRAAYDRDYLVNPQVNVTVLEYTKLTVNVLGSVNQPGPVLIPPEGKLYLMDAIARAGGFNRLAKLSDVTLTRRMPDGTIRNVTIDVRRVISGREPDTWLLQKDDIINVPEIFM